MFYVYINFFNNYDIKEFSKVEILFGIFSLREKPSCRLFLVLAFGSDSLTRIKRFAPLHSLTHIFCFAKNTRGHFVPLEPFGSLNADVIFNFWITYFLLEKETKERGLVLRTFSLTSFDIYWKGRQCFAQIVFFYGKRDYFEMARIYSSNFSSLIISAEYCPVNASLFIISSLVIILGL